jgi:hypothetical protein
MPSGRPLHGTIPRYQAYRDRAGGRRCRPKTWRRGHVTGAPTRTRPGPKNTSSSSRGRGPSESPEALPVFEVRPRGTHMEASDLDGAVKSRRPQGLLAILRVVAFIGVVLVTGGPDGSTYPGRVYAKVSFGCSKGGRPPAGIQEQPAGVASHSSVQSRSSWTLSVPEFAHVGTSSPWRGSSSSEAVSSGGLLSIRLLREKEQYI